MEYRVIDVDRRPRRCTVCGAEVCDILYRQPGTVDVEEYYKTTGHMFTYGKPGKNDPRPWPSYPCEFCGTKYRKVK